MGGGNAAHRARRRLPARGDRRQGGERRLRRGAAHRRRGHGARTRTRAATSTRCSPSSTCRSRRAGGHGRGALGRLQRRGLEGQPAVARALAADARKCCFRGSVGKGFRAPSLWDLQQPARVRQHGERGHRPGLPAGIDRRRGRALRGHAVERAQHRLAQPQARDLDAVERGLRDRADAELSFAVDYWKHREEGRDRHGHRRRDPRQPERPHALQPLHQPLPPERRSAPRSTSTSRSRTSATSRPRAGTSTRKLRFDAGLRAVHARARGHVRERVQAAARPGFPIASYLGNSFNGGNAYPRWQHVLRSTTSAAPGSRRSSRRTPSGWTEAFLGGGTHEIPRSRA